MTLSDKDKITYLNELSVIKGTQLRGVELLLAYEGYIKGLGIEECLSYIQDNKEKKEKELEEANLKLMQLAEANNKKKKRKLKKILKKK